jgi:Flp pilus assembly protein protease CpaA
MDINSLITHFVSPFFIMATVLLVGFSIRDYVKREVDNWPLFSMWIVGMALSWVVNHQALQALVISLVMFGMCYALWRKKSIGGADAKILTAIVPYLAVIGWGQWVNAFLVFLCLFLACGMIYALACKIAIKAQEVPFIAVIALTYIIFWVTKDVLVFMR